MVRLVGIASSVACAALLVGVQPTQAQTAVTGHATVRDAVHDAKKGYDITRVTVTQTASRVRMSLKVRGLSRRAGASFVVRGDIFKFDGDPHYADVYAETWINKHHHARVLLLEGEDGLPTRCSGLRASWRPSKGRVLIVSPVKCGAATWWSRKFAAESANATFDPVDKVKQFKLQ